MPPGLPDPNTLQWAVQVGGPMFALVIVLLLVWRRDAKKHAEQKENMLNVVMNLAISNTQAAEAMKGSLALLTQQQTTLVGQMEEQQRTFLKAIQDQQHDLLRAMETIASGHQGRRR